MGPYKILSRDGINYKLGSSTGRTLIAHHNLLKSCPLPIDKGTPIHPTPETPGITVREVDREAPPVAGAPRGGRGGPARPPCLRQVINPLPTLGMLSLISILLHLREGKV